MPPVGGGGGGAAPPPTQHLIVLSPGQAPDTNDPPQESAVFMQMPEPDEVLHVFLTQHCTLVASLGQYPARLKPWVVQSEVNWQVPAPSGVEHAPPIDRGSRGEGERTRAWVMVAMARQRSGWVKCIVRFLIP